MTTPTPINHDLIRHYIPGSTPENAEKTVCVTGASGFIGSHLVELLLRDGYRVRATVRDRDNQEKVEHLHALDHEIFLMEQPTSEDESEPDSAGDTSPAPRPSPSGFTGRLEIVSADLLEPGSFDEVIHGCDAVMHTASAVFLTAKDPQKEIVDVALRGTENVLQAVNKSGSVRRVVLTSSISAVLDNARPPDHVFTEADWNDSATLETEPYPLSKVLGERRAREICEAQPDQEGAWDLVAIHPTMVMGPVMTKVHCRTSPSLVRDLMRGKFPAAPNLSFGIVDVRDVAQAHLAAMMHPAPSERYVCTSESVPLIEISKLLREEFPQSKAPRRRMPDPLMYIAALFDKRLTFTFLRQNLGRQRRMDNGLIQRELLPGLRSAQESLIDTAQSLVRKGFL